MSVPLTPLKRPRDQSPQEFNGRGKWHKSLSLGSDSLSSKGSSAGNIIRLLCPVSISGGVVGEGGCIISQICQETGAKVQVEETVPGSDERVIVISMSDKGNEMVAEVKTDAEEITAEEKADNDKHVENDEEKKSAVPEDSQVEKAQETSVRKALLLVFGRMVEGESNMNEVGEEGSKSSSFIMRLLVFSNQVGRILGKAGSVIKQMSSESGAQIRVLPKDKLPSCASSSDELVQISGGVDAVRKALESVCNQLFENHLPGQDSLSVNAHGPSSHPSGPPHRQEGFFHSNRGHRFPFSSGLRDVEAPIHGGMIPPDVLIFRLLCTAEKVGSVIGKGGSVVKALQNETGCEINVVEGSSDSEDRIIVISGPAHPEERISGPQDALLRIQSRLVRVIPESKEKTVTAKLLVSSNQIGCLLGKGGAVISEMRKSTGAYIRILGKDHSPKWAAENEEVVQINGEFEAVQEALFQITSRLREHFFRDAFPPMSHHPDPGFMDTMQPFPSYMGRRELSPSGIFSDIGPPLHKFDGPGGQPLHGTFHPHDDHPPFANEFRRPGIPPQISERMPPGAPWGPQGYMEGAGRGFPDYSGAPQRRGTFGGTNNPAIITSTTVEVVVPRHVVPAIYGEEGGCLRQIREISDAKVTIMDSKPGATETVIIISGTPEQTNAAQSLIQAFVMSETEGA